MANMQVFYQLQDDVSIKWNNGIILQEYNGKIELVRSNKGLQDGKLHFKWGYPQNGKEQKPTEKAIPWKLELGDAKEAVEILAFFLRQLQGDNATDPGSFTDSGDSIPF